jgi:hypothetical protein
MAKRAAADPLERDDGYLEKKRKIDTLQTGVDVLKKMFSNRRADDNEMEIARIADTMPPEAFAFFDDLSRNKETVAAPPPREEKEVKFSSDAVSPYTNPGLILTLSCSFFFLC